MTVVDSKFRYLLNCSFSSQTVLITQDHVVSRLDVVVFLIENCPKIFDAKPQLDVYVFFLKNFNLRAPDCY